MEWVLRLEAKSGWGDVELRCRSPNKHLARDLIDPPVAAQSRSCRLHTAGLIPTLLEKTLVR